jgi:hypothetical protein
MSGRGYLSRPRLGAKLSGQRARGVLRQTGGGPRRGKAAVQLASGKAPPKPGWWHGTQPEWAIYWALAQPLPGLGLRPTIDYQYIYPVTATRGVTGYTEIDIAVFATHTGIFVNGEFFHYQAGAKKQAFDRVQYLVTESAGWTVVVIDATDANRDPLYYAAEALRGVTHSREVGLF